jgi:hypothetical protein
MQGEYGVLRCNNVGVMRCTRKQETDSIAPRFIKTDRGLGRLFDLPVDPF